MPSIDQIIQREPNPFDTETFWSGNFWQEQQDPNLMVDSIHKEAIVEIENILDLVAQDNRTRTLMLEGETGSGKTYLLGRIKRQLNPKAFFVYIEPFTASDYIWRHILRYTVDSLLEVPEGKEDSQLMIWLKGLSEFKHRSIIDMIRGDRQVFIRNLREAYPAGIYNAAEFFGVLYDLTNPKLASLACEWLRGDDLDEENLKLLKVQHSIDTEDAAQKIIANFGRIAEETQPIVLCFDQLDNIARLSDGTIDLQTLFSANSVIHNQKLKNFLVIISIITDTWRQNSHRIQPTDKDRLDTVLQLKQVSLDQAEALWKYRLSILHRNALSLPDSALYPLERDKLEEKFPGGKTKPRNVLILGRQLYQDYKVNLVGSELSHVEEKTVEEEKKPVPVVEKTFDPIAAFKLVWLRKFTQTQQRVTRVRQFSSPELIQMLAEALSALEIAAVEMRFLPNRIYANYSLSYQMPENGERVAVVWSEDQNLTKFCNFMKVCQEAIEQNLCQVLQLIRFEGVGNPHNLGYRIYNDIFEDSPHNHFMPDVSSVQYLVTYHSLVNDAYSGDLVVGEATPDIKELETLIRESQVLRGCTLLQDLGVVPAFVISDDNKDEWQPIEEFLLNRVINQQCLARQRLLQETLHQFSYVSEGQVNQLIDHLCGDNQKVRILDSGAKIEDQLVYLVRV
ncbi:ATP-binding protein [Ancylothrix sp. C2]|uniref:ATP-binding protein n=1 Tax=Ancylothrix sp. D3o TaxID=2953691 RepID=UPI0021BB4296|nr:ATP-binding protein [Ancylothrix sp. D3o]MCT7950097.1 ATP-binding protein [Ancylothrix sp. D3o]